MIRRRRRGPDERRIRIDGVTLHLRLALDLGPAARDAIDLLLGGFEAGDVTATPAEVMHVDEVPDGYVCRLDDAGAPVTLGSIGTLVDHLGDWIETVTLAEGTGSGLVRLHGALVGSTNRIVLACGASHAGKSHLALAAVRAGGAYGSDERVAVTLDASGRAQATGLARPIHLRADADDLRRDLGAEIALVEGGLRTLVPVRALEAIGGGGVLRRTTVTDLVLLVDGVPQVDGDGAVSPGWAVLVLIGLSFDAVRVGAATSLARVGALVAATRVHVAAPRTAGDLATLPLLAAAPGGDRGRRVAVRDGLGCDAVADGCTSLLIGDDVVLWIDGAPPRTALLREGRAAAWRAMLDGDGVAVVEPDLRQDLVALGALVDRPSPSEVV